MIEVKNSAFHINNSLIIYVPLWTKFQKHLNKGLYDILGKHALLSVVAKYQLASD